MKITLKVEGNEYETAEYSDRLTIALIGVVEALVPVSVASNIAAQLGLESLDIIHYSNIEAAEKDLAYILGKICPAMPQETLAAMSTTALLDILRQLLEGLSPTVKKTKAKAA